MTTAGASQSITGIALPAGELFGLGSVTALPAGLTQGLPPVYQFTYTERTVFYAGEIVSVEASVSNANGGNVPVPSALTISLLDSAGNVLSPGVVSPSNFDNNAAAATSQTLSGLLLLAAPGVYQVMWQPTLIDSVGGTGTQKPVFRVLISVMS